MHIPDDHPRQDWMRNRSLHHYPHEALAGRLGWIAFSMLVLMTAMTGCMLVFPEEKTAFTWLTMIVAIMANGFGVFSQVFSGGHCWIGAVSLALTWILIFFSLAVA